MKRKEIMKVQGKSKSIRKEEVLQKGKRKGEKRKEMYKE